MGFTSKFEINLTYIQIQFSNRKYVIEYLFATILERKEDSEWKSVLTDTSGNRYKWKESHVS